MPKLRLYLFGPPRMERDGIAINADTRKAIALMAYLAVTRQRHSRDALSTLLWPEYDQPHARATLRRTLSALNKVLAGDWLLIDRETIALDPQGDLEIDVNEFNVSLEQCYAHQHAPTEFCVPCLELLNKAGSLYTDDFMAGFSLQDSSSFDDWQFYQADSLRRELANALERLVQCYSARGEFSKAIPHARRLLTLDRLHEPAHRYLMQLYAWSGQRAAAVHQFQECVKILDQELGVAPLETTLSLYEAIKENRLPLPSIARETVREESTPVSSEQAAETESAPAPPANTYPLVGRVTEWTSLVRIYTEKAARGHIVGLEGEAGIGKTRLAEEFVAYAQSKGASTVTIRCYEGEVDLAYGPVVAGLRAAISQQQDQQWYQRIAPHWLSEAARLLPELTLLRPDLPPTPPLDSPGAQSRFFEGLRQLWLTLSNNTESSMPAVIFFDDIHWADETSLEFLSYLARRLQEKPVFLLLTWRSAQRSTVQRFHRLLTETRQSGEVWLFTLSRLDQATVEQLVQQITLSDPDLPQGLIRRLYQETEGVPLFLTEYLTAMNNGLFNPEESNWRLPGGIRDLLASRLLGVGETSRQLLGTAATIGRSFDFDTLREVSGRSEEETINGLEELIIHGLVEEIRGTEGRDMLKGAAYRRYNVGNERSPIYDFCHEKLRSLVYDEITLARRRLLHRRVAEALLARLRGQRETGPLAGQIAHHYHAAGNTETAAQYFRQAGEYARSLYAHTEALAHFRTALTLGHPDIIYLQEAIGDLHTFLGEYEAALKSYRAAEAQCEETLTRALLKHKQGKIYDRRGSWEQAEQHFATALRLLDAPTSGAHVDLQARIYADWSLTAHHQGRNEQELELARQALSLAERAGDTRSLAQAHNMLGILANGRGEMEKAHFHLERSLALADNLQDASIRAAALNNLALACKASGEVDRAITLTETALALCSSQGDRHREAALHSNLADLFHEEGRTGEAMSQLKLAARIYAEIDIEAGAMQPEIWKLVEW